MEWISGIPLFYGIWVVGLYVCLGGFFATQPTVTARAFGHAVGSTVYGVVFLGFAGSSLFQFFFVKFAVPKWGWSFIFDFYLWIALTALVFTFVFTLDKKDWSDAHKKNKDVEK